MQTLGLIAVVDSYEAPLSPPCTHKYCPALRRRLELTPMAATFQACFEIRRMYSFSLNASTLKRSKAAGHRPKSECETRWRIEKVSITLYRHSFPANLLNSYRRERRGKILVAGVGLGVSLVLRGAESCFRGKISSSFLASFLHHPHLNPRSRSSAYKIIARALTIIKMVNINKMIFITISTPRKRCKGRQ